MGKLYECCSMCTDQPRPMYLRGDGTCLSCAGVGFVEIGLTRGQVDRLVREDLARQELRASTPFTKEHPVGRETVAEAITGSGVLAFVESETQALFDPECEACRIDPEPSSKAQFTIGNVAIGPAAFFPEDDGGTVR